MSVTAQQVKELRERTGVGMMECKKALTETGGDMDAAIEHLRKTGLAQADKKAGRVAAEGIVVSAENQQRAILLEVNCETDFVAKDDSFQEFARQVAEKALASNAEDVAELNEQELADGDTVEKRRQALIARIGENVQLRRIASLSKDGRAVGSYIHGGRIGALCAVSGGDQTLARDLAMHIAAFAPIHRSPDEVPAEAVEHEKAILRAQAESSGKPADIIEKMVEGRLRKHLAEVTLYGQPYLKDQESSVADFLKQQEADVLDYRRLGVGEGIEKEESNFADEVMQQVGEQG